MNKQLDKKSILKNYAFLFIMLGAMVLGCLVGWMWPVVLDGDGNTISAGATVFKPLGSVFINTR